MAARLAEAGRKVLLLEAGGDPLQITETRLPGDYQVPAFHPFASENAAMKWDFFVRHYGDKNNKSATSSSTATAMVFFIRELEPWAVAPRITP